MAFDNTNPEDLQALKDEVINDPIAMGYGPVIRDTIQLLELLNDPLNNVGNETSAKEFTADVLLDVLDAVEYAAATLGVRGYTDMLVQYGSVETRSLEPFREKFRTLYRTNSTTVQALDAQIRKRSRVEVLFGDDTVITRQDWIATSKV